MAFRAMRTSHTYLGIGLGLYLARSITEQLGGHMEVETAQGAGSTFTVWLPLDPTAHSADAIQEV